MRRFCYHSNFSVNHLISVWASAVFKQVDTSFTLVVTIKLFLPQILQKFGATFLWIVSHLDYAFDNGGVTNVDP